MSRTVWRVERELLAMPGSYPLRILGVARLTSAAGVVMALECVSSVLDGARHFAVYWERNSQPPAMRFLPLDGDMVATGFAPLPPRSP